MINNEQIENKFEQTTSKLKRKLSKFRNDYFSAIYWNRKRLIKQLRKRNSDLHIEDFDYREISG